MAQLTQQEAIDELKRRGYSDAQLQARGISSSAIKDAKQPSKASALTSFLTGGSQGALDTVASFANLGASQIAPGVMAGGKVAKALGAKEQMPTTLPHIDIAKQMGIDTSGHPLIEGAGELVGASVLPTGIYGETMKALPAMGGLMKIIPRIGAGALSGYATGEDSQGNRGLSTIIGGLLGPLAGAGHDATVSNAKLMRQVAAQAAKTTDEGSGKYQEALKTAEDTKIEAPRADDKLIDALPSDQRISLGNMLADPNIATAHKAQSDLGKHIAQLSRVPSKTSVDIQHLEDAKKLQMDIRGAIAKGFEDSGQEPLAEAYRSATQFWARKVVPYLNSQPLQDYNAGDMSAKGALKRLTGHSRAAERFQKRVGKDNPALQDFKSRSGITNTAKKIALYAAIFSAVPGVEHLKEVL